MNEVTWKVLVFGHELAFIAEDGPRLLLKPGPENAKQFTSYHEAADASKAFCEGATQVRIISSEFQT